MVGTLVRGKGKRFRRATVITVACVRVLGHGLQISAALARGQDMNEVMRAPIPERFATISQARFELTRTVSHLYPKYEARVFQRVDAGE